jgi:hypothetical protein
MVTPIGSSHSSRAIAPRRGRVAIITRQLRAGRALFGAGGEGPALYVADADGNTVELKE